MITRALETRKQKVPSTKCLIEGLKICLFNNNSIFADNNLLQTNGTATGTPNSCSYADTAVSLIDDAIFENMSTTYRELLCYGRCPDEISYFYWFNIVFSLSCLLVVPPSYCVIIHIKPE